MQAIFEKTDSVRPALVGGGTGGHLFPAIALRESVLEKYKSCMVVTDFRCATYLKDQDQDDKTIIMSLPRVSRRPLKMLYFFFWFGVWTFILIYKFRSERINVVMGFGGYVSVPGLIAAIVLRIPIILHESNSIIGKANESFLRYSKVLTTNFVGTINVAPSVKTKIRVTGTPVRKSINAAGRSTVNNITDKLRILVVGGSQGADSFAEIIPNALEIVRKQTNHPILIIQQLHLRLWHKLEAQYEKLGFDYEFAEFFHNVADKYATVDMMICRAGASTISELIAAEKPAILLPYEFSSHNHQLINAKRFAEAGGAWCVERSNPASIAQVILKVIKKPELIESMRLNLRALQKSSASEIIEIMEDLVEGI